MILQAPVIVESALRGYDLSESFVVGIPTLRFLFGFYPGFLEVVGVVHKFISFLGLTLI